MDTIKRLILKKNIWLANNGTGHADAKIKKYDVVADDWDTAIITREQYETALAAKNDGWINWGGGECPVSASEMVDVIFGHGGRMSANIADCWRWSHDGTDSDIIAYRLHQPQEAERKRDEAVQALCYAGVGNGKVDEKAGYGSCWFDVYDAIAAGKIPGVKLED